MIILAAAIAWTMAATWTLCRLLERLGTLAGGLALEYHADLHRGAIEACDHPDCRRARRWGVV